MTPAALPPPAQPGLGASRLAPRREEVPLPVGAIVPFAGDLSDQARRQRLINQGWLPCDGTAYKISHYRALFEAIGAIYTPAGSDDGGTSFCVPDYRGQFLRGLALNSAQDPGFASRIAAPQGTPQGVGSTQGCMVQMHEHDYAALQGVAPAEAGTDGAVPPGSSIPTTGLLDNSGKTLSGEETRPKNIYVNFLIRAALHAHRLGVF